MPRAKTTTAKWKLATEWVMAGFEVVVIVDKGVEELHGLAARSHHHAVIQRNGDLF